ncbi:hypothetical protein EVAR_61929_1 [Eumeta japonica]|uniref:Zinc finger PHD-type domain-containing protein n=1 Tax=Eumeta variegata TaxID=151549 RepID=A0A4C1ZKW0_EUMVA|nr:hypothetical protein EVAR_61929_1 [Eumeta japonica]
MWQGYPTKHMKLWHLLTKECLDFDQQVYFQSTLAFFATKTFYLLKYLQTLLTIATVPMLASTSSLAMPSTPQMDSVVLIPTLVPESPLVMPSTLPMDPAVSVSTLASASLRALNTAQAYTPALPFATPPSQVVAQTSPSLIADSSSFFASATPVTQTIPQLLTPPIASTSSVLLSPILAQKNIVSSHTAFEKLLPIPEQTACVKTRKGEIKQHAIVLTYTPLKDCLLEKENKKKEKAEKEKYKNKGKKPKECKRKIEDKKTTAKAKKCITQSKIVKNKAKRRVLQDIQLTSESDSSLHNICDDDKDDDLENINETGTSTCLICTEFGRNNDIWYRCTVCGLWAHADCTGWDSAEGYVCDNC